MSTQIEIKSEYLNQTFNADAYEQDNGEIVVIKHTAIEQIVHNNVPMEYGLKYDTIPLLIQDNHIVMQCTMRDAKGRKVQALGEVTPSTLMTEIAKNYPALMAEQRAFDRAAIRYLQFPSKVYSNVENVVKEEHDGPETHASSESADSSAPVSSASSQKSQRQANVSTKNTVQPQKQMSPKNIANENIKPSLSNNRAQELGKIIFCIGRYSRNPVTLMHLWKYDRKCLDWMVNDYVGTTEQGKQLKLHCTEFKALMEGSSNEQ